MDPGIGPIKLADLPSRRTEYADPASPARAQATVFSGGFTMLSNVIHLRSHLLAGHWSRLMKIACLPTELWDQVAA